jgi:hypothetical protein
MEVIEEEIPDITRVLRITIIPILHHARGSSPSFNSHSRKPRSSTVPGPSNTLSAVATAHQELPKAYNTAVGRPPSEKTSGVLKCKRSREQSNQTRSEPRRPDGYVAPTVYTKSLQSLSSASSPEAQPSHSRRLLCTP